MRKKSLAPIACGLLLGLGCAALSLLPAAHADILLLRAITNAVQNPPVPPPDYSTNGYGTFSSVPGHTTNASSGSNNLPDYSRTVSSTSAGAPATEYPSSASSSYA